MLKTLVRASGKSTSSALCTVCREPYWSRRSVIALAGSPVEPVFEGVGGGVMGTIAASGRGGTLAGSGGAALMTDAGAALVIDAGAAVLNALRTKLSRQAQVTRREARRDADITNPHTSA